MYFFISFERERQGCASRARTEDCMADALFNTELYQLGKDAELHTCKVAGNLLSNNPFERTHLHLGFLPFFFGV